MSAGGGRRTVTKSVTTEVGADDVADGAEVIAGADDEATLEG